jgi:ABC-type transporter Mla subunit MlaD
MPTAIKTAPLELSLAERQQRLISEQLEQVSAELPNLTPGSPEHLEQSQLAAKLRSQLTQVEADVSRLFELCKSEAQRHKEAEAQRQKAAAALDRQTDADLAKLQGLIQRINAASNELAEAIAEYADTVGERSRLAETHKLIVRDTNRRPRTIIGELPYVATGYGRASLQKRHEAGLRD